MLPGNLIDVFGALTVGLLSMAVATLILWVFDRNAMTYTAYVTGMVARPRGKFGGLIFVLFSYGFGLLVEDLTDHLTDTDTEYSIYWPQAWQQALLRRESEHRFLALFKSTENGRFVARGLGNEVFSDRAYVEYMTNDYPISTEGRHKYFNGTVADGGEYVNPLYYDAKNWCYLQDNYFAELETIQQRIDFARSCFLVASWALLGLIVLLLIDFVIVRRFKMRYAGVIRSSIPHLNLAHCGDRCDSEPQKGPGIGAWESPHDATFRCHFSKVVMFLVVILFLGRNGYWHAEQVFNERAFGYRISYRRADQFDAVSARPSTAADSEETKLRANRDVVANPELANMNALLWMRTSAEYVAVCRQIYEHASTAVHAIREAKVDKPWAVVMDLDETVLDNTSFNAYLIERRVPFKEELWNEWLERNSESVRTVPGAQRFIGSLPADVHVVFVSNRNESNRANTIDTLSRLNLVHANKNGSKEDNAEYWNAHLLLKTDGSSKVSRRRQVEERFAIAALIGDNLADFAIEFEYDATASWIQRREHASIKTEFGAKWFVLPNPMYGDWERAIRDARSDIIQEAAGPRGSWEKRTTASD